MSAVNPDDLRPRQVADLCHVTRDTVYDWITSGRLRAYRLGGSWRVTRADLDAFAQPEGDPLDAHIVALVSSAPELTVDQLVKLAAIFGSAATS